MLIFISKHFNSSNPPCAASQALERNEEGGITTVADAKIFDQRFDVRRTYAEPRGGVSPHLKDFSISFVT